MFWRKLLGILLCSIAALAASDEAAAWRLEEVRARGELRACIWPDYYAISFRNPRSDALEGLEIDLARGLAARLGTRLHFVETDFVGFLDRVAEGDCDVATMGVGVTPERARRVVFTRPYLVSPVYAVTTRSHARIRRWADVDTPGSVVAVAAGSALHVTMTRTLRVAELMVIAPPRTREAELLAGRADVFMTDFTYSRRLLLLHEWAQVLEAPPQFGDTPYAWAVAPGDPAWLAELDAFLAGARADGTLERAAARHGLTRILVR